MRFRGQKIKVSLHDGTSWDYFGNAYTVSIDDDNVRVYRGGELFNVFTYRSVREVETLDIQTTI